MKGKTVQTQICLPEEVSEEILELLRSSPDHLCRQNDVIYLLAEQTIICIPDCPGRNELIHAITRKNENSLSTPQNAGDIYEKIIKEPDYKPDSAILQTNKVLSHRTRCIIIFRSLSPLIKNLFSILYDMAPVEKGDSILPVDYQTCVFVKDLNGQNSDEIKEFSEAVIGTLEAEGISDVHAAIGRQTADLSELRMSYLEGLRALSLGIRYHHRDRVYVYEEQKLERIVDAIPENQKREIIQTFFKNGSANGISHETLETARVFFQNDLNLTATSRQLYIHRNTLNYRLDKIKKEHGLDLRSFRDAVVFRIITEITDGNP